ncbi:cilia- and flagella-associated protein 45-like isoform X2 [Thrips palmi]|nr:cilia- and flagella-associated protein 45-like isoform X2 [Thrips palmi]XP_034243068.1 cilia- and flagella-associated protein 45-like isoform X2 [Thrips palmi]XP_034243069.1 cilia- and flagella-associated protein 45-like isoform X2 [Thrips palmi]
MSSVSMKGRTFSSKPSNEKKCTALDVAMTLPKRFQKPATYGKEVLTLKGPDMVRKLVVPGPEPNVHPIYFDKGEFCRLVKQSKVLTPSEKLKQQEAAESARRRLEKESTERKEKLNSFEKYRVKSVRLAELEADAERKAAHLLARARELQQESQDEVKSANRLIISTKCHAIRSAQMAEKQLIQKELIEEEQRLDKMMEQQRMIGLKEEEKRKEEEALKNQRYLKALLHQIQENETGRIHEAERKEEESRLMNEAAMQVQMEELQAYHNKLEEQAKTRQFLGQVNEQLKYFQDLEREEKRQAELKVQKFMADKAAREAALEEEHRKNRLAKELEIARLRAAQERMSDLKSQQDELKALRTQDEVEREWRRKEKEEAIKKAKEEQKLKQARQEQIEHRRSMQALEIAREKQQFERIIRSQQLEAERERLEQIKRQSGLEAYRTAILEQINEKERERIRERKLKFQEGDAVRAEEESRKRELQLTMKRKIEELRANKVPEAYIKEIERQLKLNEAT